MCCGLFILPDFTSSELLGQVSHLHKEDWTPQTLCCLQEIHHHYNSSCRTSFCDSGSIPYTTFLLLDAIQVNIPVDISVSPDISKTDQKNRELEMTTDLRGIFARYLLRAFDTGRVPLFLVIVEVHSEPDNMVTDTQQLVL